MAEIDNLAIEHFFRSLQSPGNNEIVVVVDTCSFIKYHEAIATFLPTFHHYRKDLKFFFPWVVHQELDAMKAKRVPDYEWGQQSIHSAVGVIDMLLDLSCVHPSLSFTFQNANDAANCAAANLPHNANDDDILLSALYLCHNNADGLRRVFVWTADRILVNKIRVSGLSAICDRDGKLVVLSPPPAIGGQTVDPHAAIRNVVITPPDEIEAFDNGADGTARGSNSSGGGPRRMSASEMMSIDSPDEELNLAHCVKATSPLSGDPYRGGSTGFGRSVTVPRRSPLPPPQPAATYMVDLNRPRGMGEDVDWGSDTGIVPRHLQQPHLQQPPQSLSQAQFQQSGRISQMDAGSGMFWEFDQEPRSQSAIPSMNFGGRSGSASYNPRVQQGSLPQQPCPYVRPSSNLASRRSLQPSMPGNDPLSVFLVDVVTREMTQAYGSDIVWTDICCLRRKPTNWREAITCIDRHWIAVFKMVFGTSKVVTNARDIIHGFIRSESAPMEDLMMSGRVLANAISNNPVHAAAARDYLRSVPFVAEPTSHVGTQQRRFY